MVGLEVGESLKVMVESGRVKVVGQECLPTLLALDKRGLVDERTWVFVDLGVFCFQPGGCRGCWLMIQPVQSNH